MSPPADDVAWPLGIALGVFVLISFAAGLLHRERITNSEDFIVAGRRLPLSLSFATLLATWFGAGTMLTAADEVRSGGLRMAALEPLGAGLCLVLAGLFFASRLWEMKLLTLSDFFARRFGPRAELLSAFVMVPGYFGWIAVQFIALAGMLELFLGMPLPIGIAVVALVGMGYTLVGGMWAVALTDAVQLVVLLAGLLVLGGVVWVALGESGDALAVLQASLPAEMLEPVPTESFAAFVGWSAVLAVAALGNIPGQDLLQRVFSAKSARVARTACILAGIAYISFGSIPVLLGLSSRVLAPELTDAAIVPALVALFLSKPMTVLFALSLTAAVLSTIDSAILSPASVISQNIVLRLFPSTRTHALRWNRIAVVLVTAVSLATAYVGEDAYSLLESAYEIGFVGLFVPLAMGVYKSPTSERPALAAMAIGTAVWTTHMIAGWEFFLAPLLSGLELPVTLPAVAAAFFAYLAADAPFGTRASGSPAAT